MTTHSFDTDDCLVSAARDEAIERGDGTGWRQLLTELETANRAKDEFLATLSHELRQPLSAIGSALAVLRATTHGAGSPHAWEVADRQLEHLTRLIEDLHDLSGIARGMVSLRHDAIDLRDVVVAAAEVNSSAVRRRVQRLDVVSDDTPVIVVGDRARLQQIVSNLIHNASKFTPEQGAIAVSLRAVEGIAVVTVSDSGRGIACDQLDRIFEPFAQGDDSAGGLGLGLAVVKRLVQLHGGGVEAHSAGDGAGSVFIVSIPLATDTVCASVSVSTAHRLAFD